MIISLPSHFNFFSTINSHGWYDLPPFTTNATKTELHTIISLTKNKHVPISMTSFLTQLKIKNTNNIRLTTTEKERIKNVVRSMLRIDEPLEEFYAICKKEKHLRWIIGKGAGRMLRSPSFFEDVVKMLFTTNCSWALTKIQTEKITSKLGASINEKSFSFPSPERIGKKTERWLRKEISCGYRAPYLLKLCRDITYKRVEIESFRHSNLPTEELYWQLRSIKGIGHYAAGNLLKLLGRYDYLGIDSWVRKKFSQIHKKGRKVSDAVIEKHYERYGKWRGLICWMEVTSDWHI